MSEELGYSPGYGLDSCVMVCARPEPEFRRRQGVMWTPLLVALELSTSRLAFARAKLFIEETRRASWAPTCAALDPSATAVWPPITQASGCRSQNLFMSETAAWAAGHRIERADLHLGCGVVYHRLANKTRTSPSQNRRLQKEPHAASP